MSETSGAPLTRLLSRRELERDILRQEIAALDADQMHVLLLMLAGSDPGAVRHALDVERATRRAGAEAR